MPGGCQGVSYHSALGAEEEVAITLDHRGVFIQGL